MRVRGLPHSGRLHGRVIHPAGKGIAFFLQLVKVGFHLRDTAGDIFGAAAEVHPAQLIQLRLQVIYFAFRSFSFSEKGTIPAPPVSARRRFSSSISSGRELFIPDILPGSFSVDQDKEAYNIVSDVSSLLGLPPVDTFKEHRQLRRGQEHFAIAS